MALHTALKRISWGTLCLALSIAANASAATDADIEYFESNVRPILAERCYECHGPDEQESNMRLDHITFMLNGGDFGPALVPGDATESNMVEAINWIDPDFQMPPKKKLSDSEIATLTKWIALGAPWPNEPLPEAASNLEEFDLAKRKSEHWAWQPIRNPTIPSSTASTISTNPIDAFIREKLDAKGLTPATRADKRTLIRRLYFDLIGLPPTPKAVNDFVLNDDPDAYAQLVDTLLAHSGFGERWGRHWLDITRFAESYGHEGDYPIRHAWRYRDYVIRALNEDVPYDQFVREQIAGDLIEKPRMHPEDAYNESIIGTGWWFMHQATHGPVDVLRDEADRIDNQIDVMSKAFLGMTVACARCHDHKFDAISTKDYYALTSYLRSSRQQFAYLDPHRKIEAAADTLFEHQQRSSPDALDIISEFAPYTKDIAAYLDALRDMVGKDFDIEAKTIAKPTKEKIKSVAVAHGLDPEIAGRWVDALLHEYSTHPSHPFRPWTQLLSGKSMDSTQPPQDTEVFAHFNSGSFEGWTTYGEAFGAGPTVQHEVSPTGNSTTLLPGGVVHSARISKKLRGVLRSPTFTLDHDWIFFRAAGKDTKVRLVIQQYQIADFNPLLFGGTIAKVESGSVYTWRFHGVSLRRYKGLKAYIEIIDDSEKGWIAVDEIRFSNHPLAEREVQPALESNGADFETQTGLAEAYQSWAEDGFRTWKSTGANSVTTGYLNFLLEHQLLDLNDFNKSSTGTRLAAIRTKHQRLEAALPQPLVALAMDSQDPVNARLYIRGNHKTPGDAVPSRFLDALGGRAPAPDAMREGRLQLANEMVSDENPLTDRVLVNRIWHHMFGRGIVKSVDNFGVLGTPPSHPELLDYLATYFRENGHSIKQLIRHIAHSNTYAMSSTLSDGPAQTIDPANVLLHRQNIRRLEGEIIRDAILAVTGQLDTKMYGNSVPPFLDSHSPSIRRPKETGPLDGERRRSIYLRVQRNFLPRIMLAFDMPLPYTTTGKRTVSNVPAQSLILMNDTFVRFQAGKWAEELIRQHPDSEFERIEAAYLTAFGRAPTKIEYNQIMAFLTLQSMKYGLSDKANKLYTDLWRDFCQVLMMSKEFIYIS